MGATDLEPAADVDRGERRGDVKPRLCASSVDIDGGRALEGLKEVEANGVDRVALRREEEEEVVEEGE